MWFPMETPTPVHKDFLLDDQTVKILRKISRDSGLSMSAVVRVLIREGGKGRIRLSESTTWEPEPEADP